MVAVQKETIQRFDIQNLHYTRGIMLKRVTSGGIHLRGLGPGQHSSEETSQQWRAIGDTVSNLTDRESNPRPLASIAMSLSTTPTGQYGLLIIKSTSNTGSNPAQRVDFEHHSREHFMFSTSTFQFPSPEHVTMIERWLRANSRDSSQL